jgi:hypothetical protein
MGAKIVKWVELKTRNQEILGIKEDEKRRLTRKINTCFSISISSGQNRDGQGLQPTLCGKGLLKRPRLFQ